MKISHLLLAAVCLFVCSVAKSEEGVADLPIGAAAPDLALPGIDGKTHKLADYQAGKVLVVFFTSNHCPTSHGAADRLKTFLADYRPKGMTFVAINPNHPDGLSIDELGYSKYSDGFEDMKKYAAEEGFDFPYLYDGDTQAVAKAYGCLATPHVFVFDADRKLRYKGGFDDSRFGGDDSTVQTPYTRNAVKAVLAGEPVPVEITKPEGCTTKWRSKHNAIAQKMEKWNQVPVDVETIDAEGVAALRKGGTPNVRLINVWATWCEPCVAEFPELVSASRQFDLRNFEFISISADDPKELPTQIPKIKTFLEKNNAGLSTRLQKSVKAEGRKTNSYVYSGAKLEDLMKALDPEWPGGLPHTVLVDTSGKILWRKNGPVSGDELRAKVLETLGNYYTR